MLIHFLRQDLGVHGWIGIIGRQETTSNDDDDHEWN